VRKRSSRCGETKGGEKVFKAPFQRGKSVRKGKKSAPPEKKDSVISPFFKGKEKKGGGESKGGEQKGAGPLYFISCVRGGGEILHLLTSERGRKPKQRGKKGAGLRAEKRGGSLRRYSGREEGK